MALKLNMYKAYNRVKWKFLERILVKMGFPNHWCDLILKCITIVCFVVLINGAPSKGFKAYWGWRKGTPCPLTNSSFMLKHFPL